MLLYLPPEIWGLIAHSLKNEQASLARLCLVSRTFNGICTPLLYEKPQLRDSSCGLFLQTLVTRPHLAQRVKFLNNDSNWDTNHIYWKDLSLEVRKCLNDQHLKVLELKSVLSNDVMLKAVKWLLHNLVACSDSVSGVTLQSMLVSLLPNLQEARLRALDGPILVTVPPAALGKLKHLFLESDFWGTNFSEFHFIAQAATRLESLSIVGSDFNITVLNPPYLRLRGWVLSLPCFPTVTRLNLDVDMLEGLDHHASAFMRSFPSLLSFRLDGGRDFSSPSEPKLKALLSAIATSNNQLGVPLEHLCLANAINTTELKYFDDQKIKVSTWPATLKLLSHLTSLRTLSIDAFTLWPFSQEDKDTLPPSLLADCLPKSLHRLHINAFEGLSVMLMKDLEACLCKLAQEIKKGKKKFAQLQMVSYSVDHMDKDLANASEALKAVGITLDRKDCPWKREGLYEGEDA